MSNNIVNLNSNSEIWFTADWHCGEQKQRLMQRPFQNADDDFWNTLTNHNSVVSHSGLVIVVGDVISTRAENPGLWLARMPWFRGKKWLIRGNHDRQFTDEQLSPYFDKIIPDGEGLEIQATISVKGETETKIHNLGLCATHYPTRSRSDLFNLVGHVHGAWKYQKNMLNVGIDSHHFRPMNMRDIPFFLAAIESFYDDDVWCANHPANVAFDCRGKRGSYFVQT